MFLSTRTDFDRWPGTLVRAMLLLAVAAPHRVLAQEGAPATDATSAPTERAAKEPAKQAPAPPLELDLAGACALARQSGPRSLAHAALVEVAEAQRVDAGIFPRTNPVLEVMGGPTLSAADPLPRFTASLTQTIPLGGGLTAREGIASASVARATADANLAAVALSGEVANAFIRAQWAAERIRASTEILGIVTDTLRASELRLQASDISRLELNVARVAVSRATAALASAEAEHALHLGELRVLLGVPARRPLVLQGALGDAPELDLTTLLGKTDARPDLARAIASLDAATAEADLADALAAPDLGFGVAYELEGEAHTVMGVLSLTLPFFDHGQGLAARSEAERRRSDAERSQLLATIPIEVRAKWEVYEQRRAAVRALEDAGANAYQENLALAKKGYEAGETTLPELLALRREILEAKLEHTDRQREVREAAIAVQIAAGVSP